MKRKCTTKSAIKNKPNKPQENDNEQDKNDEIRITNEKKYRKKVKTLNNQELYNDEGIQSSSTFKRSFMLLE
ncbi:17075_t:CDS:1, partial [Funneliformis caledonium]